MEGNKNSIVRFMKKYGLLFPSNEQEVALFEDQGKLYSGEIIHFEDPIKVLKLGKQKLQYFESTKILSFNTEAENLAIAARDGKTISNNVQDQMNKDRNDSEKKQK